MDSRYNQKTDRAHGEGNHGSVRAVKTTYKLAFHLRSLPTLHQPRSNTKTESNTTKCGKLTAKLRDVALVCLRINDREVSLSAPPDDAKGLTIEDTVSGKDPLPGSIVMGHVLLDALHAEQNAIGSDGKLICKLLSKHCKREAVN